MRINKDHVYLDKLRDYYARHRILPSYSTIGEMVGIRATSAVTYMVNRLKEKGYLESSPDRRLQPGPNFFLATVIDSAQAGSPVPATDNQPIDIDIMGRLLKNPSKSRLFEVNGDSMIDEGLRNGDFVVVLMGAKPKRGDIVVVRVGGGYTVKKWAEDTGGVILKAANAANKNFHDIRPVEDDKAIGVVTGSFRSYDPKYRR